MARTLLGGTASEFERGREFKSLDLPEALDPVVQQLFKGGFRKRGEATVPEQNLAGEFGHVLAGKTGA